MGGGQDNALYQDMRHVSDGTRRKAHHLLTGHVVQFR